ncbi:hypothetical protein ACFPIF_15635 [Brevundimonas faecalis]|uniref:hypothetical protein n=1 Tax=Brevundimonas faecalis TaxID=947378 RepID=UPI003607EA1E
MKNQFPRGVASLIVDEHPTHGVILIKEDGTRSRAKSVIWNEQFPPNDDWAIDDERPIGEDGEFL